MGTEKRIQTVSKDFVYNITASVLLTGIMQIVVYPLLARSFSDTRYGIILTVMGITNTIIVALGNTLNNVRLIVNSDYNKEHIQGDFQFLILISSAVGIISSLFVYLIVFKMSIIDSLLLSTAAFFAILKSYYCVEFRLLLNFKKILIQNIWGALGYVVGSVLVLAFKLWPLPFVIAEFLQFSYVLKNGLLIRERLIITPRFKTTALKYLILIITGMSSTLILYLDRIIIYPLIGSQAVSTYSVASVFGKSLGILMTPIAGVLLGYYAQNDFKMGLKKFWIINGVALLGGVIFILFSVAFSPIATRFLYPTIYDQAKKYILWANLAATISVVCNLTQSSVLKFAPTWLQIIKEAAYCVVYIFCGIYLMEEYGLLGFCVAAILANSVKLIVLYTIGSIYIR